MEELKNFKFVKLPKDEKGKELEEFKGMLGHTYEAYLSTWNKEYVIVSGINKAAEEAFQESIFKSLVAIGESEEFARKCARGEEDPGMCLYFKKDCLEEV